MKAVVFKRVGQPLVLEERPEPEIKSDQLLVRVKTAGVCGSDLHASEQNWTPANIVMGHEFAGEVVAVGKDVTGWSVGDRAVPLAKLVCGECTNCIRNDYTNCENSEVIGFSPNADGGFAEYARISAATALHLPDGLEYLDAAIVEPLAVGYNAVRIAELKMNDSVLIVGAGPIGLCIAQWCKHFGVTDVAVSELNTARLSLAIETGANILIDGNKVDDPAAEFKRITGRNPSVIVEAVGVPGMIQRCIEIAAMHTRIVVVGVCFGYDQFQPMLCFEKRLKLIFAAGYSVDDFAEILKLMDQGRISGKPLVSHRIRLEELPDMFERMRRPTDQIKVIVEP
ncbi:MAG: alcohol dehydrogenase catalytic domain-containing protein [Gammaproteobacteria bacterium]|nr:alcohol dehydrogenase catalytic domain-containing protein [Gammaproteobacteria bacterium]MDE0368422.1 alcohol dehydrogenase catalytic domain-containing protein [Gammaproteobacteria bacterium]